MSALSTGRQRPETAAGLAFPAGRGGASLPVLSALTEGVAGSAGMRLGTCTPSVSAFTERSPNGLALVEDVGRARRRGTTGGSRPILLRGDPMAASEKRTPACELVERPRSPRPAGGRHVARPNRTGRGQPRSPLQTRPSGPPERRRPVLTAATQPTGRLLYH